MDSIFDLIKAVNFEYFFKCDKQNNRMPGKISFNNFDKNKKI